MQMGVVEVALAVSKSWVADILAGVRQIRRVNFFFLTMDVDQEQVQVRFVSRQPQYAINDAAILVPSSFRRYGLSEIVNNLLGNGRIDRLDRVVFHSLNSFIEKPIPFEFFVDEQILKTSIAEYLTANRLSTVTKKGFDRAISKVH